MTAGRSCKEIGGLLMRYLCLLLFADSKRQWSQLYVDIAYSIQEFGKLPIRNRIVEYSIRSLSRDVSRRARRVGGRSTSSMKPPVNAEFLFYLFMTPQNCDALVGDLEERYKLIHRKFGRRRADFWYWTQAIWSLGPIVWAWAKQVSLKPVVAVVSWAIAKGLIGHDGWLAALMELWKRVRS
jgi:hypothetical protein